MGNEDRFPIRSFPNMAESIIYYASSLHVRWHHTVVEPLVTPVVSQHKLIAESWENAVYAAVPKEMISTTLMLSLNYVVFHGHR